MPRGIDTDLVVGALAEDGAKVLGPGPDAGNDVLQARVAAAIAHTNALEKSNAGQPVVKRITSARARLTELLGKLKADAPLLTDPTKKEYAKRAKSWPIFWRDVAGPGPPGVLDPTLTDAFKSLIVNVPNFPKSPLADLPSLNKILLGVALVGTVIYIVKRKA